MCIPFSNLESAFEDIEETADAAGRDPDEITVAPYVPAAVSSDDPERARDAIRGHVAYYVGSGEGYRRAVAQSFPDAADEIASHWADGDRGAARGAVTDEMIEALGVAGTPEEARAQLAALQDGIVDLPIVTVPQQATDLALETIQALAPE
jgi:alkanesulfonate monooxygenase SsuD/methylene tetrahydromethanopterin reductase-like flavin-dependent oxidoreductase (luciferase family)